MVRKIEANEKRMAGRPTVMTEEVVSILITSFQNGLNTREACWQAGISHETFYKKMRQDPEFTDTIERAKSSPSITAKANIVKAINGKTRFKSKT